MTGRFEEVHRVLNERLFEGTLASPKFEKDLGRKCVLHFSPPNSYQYGSEIVTAPPDLISSELVHAMIHAKNHAQGVIDSTQNQYHNTHFLQEALRVGFCVVWHKSRGWALTFVDTAKAAGHEKFRLPDEAANSVLKAAMAGVSIPKKSLGAWQRELAGELADKPKKTFLLKYICRCSPPHNTVRSGRRPEGDNPLDITCNTCKSKFVVER